MSTFKYSSQQRFMSMVFQLKDSIAVRDRAAQGGGGEIAPGPKI